MSASTRYWLAQVPGWVAAGLILAAAWLSFGLPGWAALALLALLVAKDVALYPLSRRALESPPQTGAGALVGRRALVVERLEPEGRVRVAHEVWRARVPAAEAPVDAGLHVRVEGVNGLLLRVRREPEGGAPA